MKGEVSIALKLDEEKRQQLRLIGEESDEELSTHEIIGKLIESKATELEEYQEAVSERQAALSESLGDSDENHTSSSESRSQDSEAARKQAEVADKMFNGGN